MLNVITVVGTRPEIIRLSRTIAIFDKYCHHTLVHTGQNYDYELNEVFFNDLGIRKPDFFLEAAGLTPAETIGNVIISIDIIFEKIKPEALLVLGDTNSSLVSISAKRRKIPIFHMEAGNRCFDFRVPEEINRRIVDHISDINLCYSSIARDYLLTEGFPPDQVIVSGSPMMEVLEYYSEGIKSSDILDRLDISHNNYFLVSCHREENVDRDDSLIKFINILNGLAEKFALPVLVTTHPRTRKRIDKLSPVIHTLVEFQKPFGFFDYINLQINSRAVLSDSGTITEESSILNFPALNLREVHERPEGFEEASVMMVGLDFKRVTEALLLLENQPRNKDRLLKIVHDYNITNFSQKLLRIVLSYTDFVNRKVWRK